MNYLIRYLKSPFAKTGALFAGFLLAFIFLSKMLPGRLITLMAAAGVGLLFLEGISRNLVPVFIEKVLPLVPWIFFVVLSVCLLVLIPYAAPRAWNNMTGIVLVVSVFLIVRQYGRIPFLEEFFISLVFTVLVFFVMFPGILGAVVESSGRTRLGAQALGGGGTNPNDVARLLGISGLLLAVGLPCKLKIASNLLDQLPMAKILRAFGVVMAIFLIMTQTGSRSGLVWVAAILGFFVLARFDRNFAAGLFLCIVTVATATALAFLIFPNNPIISRVMAIFDELAFLTGGDGSFNARWLMIMDGLQLWTESPIWGKGNEAFRVLAGWDTYSHSNYIELLANYGILGFTAFYLPFVFCGWEAWRLRKSRSRDIRRMALWLLICCSIPLILSFVNVIYFTRYMLVFYGIIFGKIYFLKDNLATLEMAASQPRPPPPHPMRRPMP